MIVTYWGVRGSMPSPGSTTIRYGGNTACVSVESGNDILIIDSGTGIRTLGKSLAGTDQRIFLALSHLHLDHVAGFPLFAPLFEEGRILYLIGCPYQQRVWTPLELMDGVFWPVMARDVPSEPRVVGNEGFAMLSEAGLKVDLIPVNHPGGAFGFRISDGMRSFVHISDNELGPRNQASGDFERITEFCRNADVLSHDAQYLANEMPTKEGWGHSLVASVCALAIEARVGCLVLFHHDPDRTDDALDEIGRRSTETLRPHAIECVVASEGLRLDLGLPDFSQVRSNSPEAL